MRAKHDILLLLSVLVISGVIISNVVIIRSADKSTKTTVNLSLFNSQFQTDQSMKKRMEHKLKQQEFARIDLSKQQTR